MTHKTDEMIQKQAELLPILDIAEKAGILSGEIEYYGRYKAKIAPEIFERTKDFPDGKLILVTAVNPTPAGEGKSTVSVGLADGLSQIGCKTILALREPSLGPVFGMKGGAAGGGYSQVGPMDDINLHFTGDIHAVGAANNLLAAIIDNHIFGGNSLKIDARRITWRRCMDINDRQLRSIVTGLGGKTGGFPREDGFDITVASEVMACLCLSRSISELKSRLGKIIIGYSLEGAPVTAGDLKAQGAMAALLKEAIRPNLVQTLGHTPAFIHGGPFANIAHGCNSIIATKLALKLSDYVVTEAGFGADLGAEKFIDIKCRNMGIMPSACVIVATVRALKAHGGVLKDDLYGENIKALEEGFSNLQGHIENITKKFGIPAAVCINRFSGDSETELKFLCGKIRELGIEPVVAEVWAKGGAGGTELARVIKDLCNKPSQPKTLYPDNMPVKDKINTIVREIYGGTGAEFSSEALKSIKELDKNGFSSLPVCMAKTQYSFSDNPKLKGRPAGFKIKVTKIKVSSGAGFIVVYTGDVMTMPGLPKIPAANNIDVSDEGNIVGLY